MSWHVGRCAVYVWVMRDEARVFVGGGEFGDAPVREADVLETEALAERFRSPELWSAATRMHAAAGA